jgi:hypothetical protein
MCGGRNVKQRRETAQTPYGGRGATLGHGHHHRLQVPKNLLSARLAEWEQALTTGNQRGHGLLQVRGHRQLAAGTHRPSGQAEARRKMYLRARQGSVFRGGY